MNRINKLNRYDIAKGKKPPIEPVPESENLGHPMLEMTMKEYKEMMLRLDTLRVNFDKLYGNWTKQ